MMMKYLTLLYTHLKWVLDFLTYYPFYKLHDSHFPIIGEMYNTCNYESTLDHSDEDLECAVCLCKIEDEDEIRVLRCDHMYHKHCLDKWVGFKNNTCPLCRESLRPKRVITENHCREFCNPFSILGLSLESDEVNHMFG
jgi:E3 ubiquitin-protein ligase RHA2